jgi:uncharacterized protein (TIGR02453 family)
MSVFSGFPRETVEFFENLKENNSKEWFNQNKEVYEASVLEPAKDFVIALGERLQEIAPDVVAIPKTDKSIFRIYRDTRFSKNKLPYKTHLGILFWEGDKKKLENPGFYFQLSPPTIMLATGHYGFPKTMLEPYREAVIDAKKGNRLADILAELKAKNYKIGRTHYKRVPRGYDADHANAELLKHDGLYASTELPVPDLFYTPGLIDFCFETYNDMAALHRWLLAI